MSAIKAFNETVVNMIFIGKITLTCDGLCDNSPRRETVCSILSIMGHHRCQFLSSFSCFRLKKVYPCSLFDVVFPTLLQPYPYSASDYIIGKLQAGNTFIAYDNLSILFFQSTRQSFSTKMLKRVSDRSHPCLTLTVILDQGRVLPFIWTAFVSLS